jgi:hypothetical protein
MGEKHHIFLADGPHVEGLRILQPFNGLDKLLENGAVITNWKGLDV